MKKYTTVTISGIHTQIAMNTNTKGYSVGVMEVFLPTDEEMKGWSDKKTGKWIAENNKRMEAICNFLNGSGL